MSFWLFRPIGHFSISVTSWQCFFCWFWDQSGSWKQPFRIFEKEVNIDRKYTPQVASFKPPVPKRYYKIWFWYLCTCTFFKNEKAFSIEWKLCLPLVSSVQLNLTRFSSHFHSRTFTWLKSLKHRYVSTGSDEHTIQFVRGFTRPHRHFSNFLSSAVC